MGGAPSSHIEPGTAAFRHATLALSSAGFATFALLHCVQPLLPEFSRQFRIGATASSLAVSLTTICLAVSLPVLGALSEVWGRKSIIVASLLLTSMLTIVSGLVARWPVFLAIRALEGVAFAGLPALAMAYLGEEFHPRVIGRAMGLYVAGTAFGGMAGRLVAAGLTDFVSWRFAMVAIGSLGLLAGLNVWWRLPSSVHFRPRPLEVGSLVGSYRAHLRDPVLARLFAQGFLLLGGFIALYNYVPFRLMAPPFGLSQASVGFVFVVFLVGMLGSAWSGSGMGRMGRPRILTLNIGLMILGMLATALPWLPAVIGGIALVTFGFFGAHSVGSAWVAVRAQVGRAQATALYLVFYYAGSAVAGTSGGLFWTRLEWPGVAGFIIALLLAALALARSLVAADAAAQDEARHRPAVEGA